MKQALAIVLGFAFPFITCGATISPVFNGSLDFGGEKIVDVTNSDGSKSNIEAGRGILLNGGAIIDISGTTPHTFEAQTTFGIKWTSTKEASNGEVDFYRWPLEILSFYRNTEKNFRLGAGLSYQIGNELKGSKDAASVSTKIKNATGWVFEGDYLFGAKAETSIGVRYTTIRYEPENSGKSVNGDSWGFNLTYFWR